MRFLLWTWCAYIMIVYIYIHVCTCPYICKHNVYSPPLYPSSLSPFLSPSLSLSLHPVVVLEWLLFLTIVSSSLRNPVRMMMHNSSMLVGLNGGQMIRGHPGRRQTLRISQKRCLKQLRGELKLRMNEIMCTKKKKKTRPWLESRHWHSNINLGEPAAHMFVWRTFTHAH